MEVNKSKREITLMLNKHNLCWGELITGIGIILCLLVATSIVSAKELYNRFPSEMEAIIKIAK